MNCEVKRLSMREILFRGHVSKNEWVHGLPIEGEPLVGEGKRTCIVTKPGLTYYDGMFARPEQQNQPASETRTNLDRIRAMSAEDIANWARENLGCCSCPISDSQGYSCEAKNCMATFIKWLNSPVKEDTK